MIEVLEEWGAESKFIWFRELHRITDIDKGVLRNILNELKKTKEVKEMHGTNNRIFFSLRRYYIKCRDRRTLVAEGKEIMLRDRENKNHSRFYKGYRTNKEKITQTTN